MDDELLIGILKESHTLTEATLKVFGSKDKKYRDRIKRRCRKIGVEYRELLLPREESHYYCKYCGKEISGKNRKFKVFCNSSCAASFNNRNRKKKSDIICLNCGKAIPSTSTNFKYCSHQCQFEYQYKNYIERWKKGEVSGASENGFNLSNYVRRYILEKNEYKCEICGFNGLNPYTNNTILQIHHIDGDCSNNKENNLQLLCPNCHAMTENYGSRNKFATKGRSKYFGRAKN